MQAESKASMAEIGTKLSEGLKSISDAIGIQQARVSEAEKGVSAAQITPGADQAGAIGALQSEQLALQNLEEQRASIIREINNLGSAAKEGTDSAARAMTEGSAVIIAAGQSMAGAAAAAATDYAGAAGQVTKATQDANGVVVGAVGELGNSIQRGFNTVADTVGSVVDRLAAQEARLQAVAQRAAAAESAALAAQAQAQAAR
jgi:hypothetical protein